MKKNWRNIAVVFSDKLPVEIRYASCCYSYFAV